MNHIWRNVYYCNGHANVKKGVNIIYFHPTTQYFKIEMFCVFQFLPLIQILHQGSVYSLQHDLHPTLGGRIVIIVVDCFTILFLSLFKEFALRS
jgi:hypothetical protein